jgi:hypothetical protein
MPPCFLLHNVIGEGGLPTAPTASPHDTSALKTYGSIGWVIV